MIEALLAGHGSKHLCWRNLSTHIRSMPAPVPSIRVTMDSLVAPPGTKSPAIGDIVFSPGKTLLTLHGHTRGSAGGFCSFFSQSSSLSVRSWSQDVPTTKFVPNTRLSAHACQRT